MEPIQEGPEGGAQSATRKRSRVKAAMAAVAVAGALTVWGVASVFAASPTPSPGASSGTTPAAHTCPAHTSASGSGSPSSS